MGDLSSRWDVITSRVLTFQDYMGLEGRVGDTQLGWALRLLTNLRGIVSFILVPPRRPRRPIDSPYCGRGPLIPTLGAGPVRCTSLNR